MRKEKVLYFILNLNKKMSYDYLPNTNIKLIQKQGMFKMNTDTHLLGEYIEIRPNDVVLDIGTNNGALLLYASQFKHKKLIGIDINEEAINIAKENMLLNNVEAQLINIKVQDLKIDNVDVIICNPPYFNDEKYLNDNLDIKNARHTVTLSMEELFASYRSLLKDSGRIYMVHRASKIVEIISLCSLYKIKVRKMKFVYDSRKKGAKAVLIELSKGINGDILVEDPKVI